MKKIPESKQETIWDYTRLDTFLTCRRKYYYQMIKHLQPKVTAAPLNFGDAVHQALDAYYINNKNIELAIAKFTEVFIQTEGETLRTRENGITLLSNYAKVYKNEPFTLLPGVKPESGFVIPIGDVMWGGRMDLPVLWDNSLYIMEHKTTSRLTSYYPIQFDLDNQITSYVIGAEETLRQKCFGCIINALEPSIPLIRPTIKSKKPEDHYARFPISRSSEVKERFKLKLQQVVRDATWCEENNEFYCADKKEVCFYYNKPCPYKELCLYGEKESIIENDFIIKEWKPYEVITSEDI